MLEPRKSASLAPSSLEVRPIFLGSLADVAGTVQTELLIQAAMLFAWMTGDGGLSAALPTLNLVRGLLFTGLGGFIAARNARQQPVQHALVAGVISLVISVIWHLATPGASLSGLVLIGLASVVPVALLGGLLGQTGQREP